MFFGYEAVKFRKQLHHVAKKTMKDHFELLPNCRQNYVLILPSTTRCRRYYLSSMQKKSKINKETMKQVKQNYKQIKKQQIK